MHARSIVLVGISTGVLVLGVLVAVASRWDRPTTPQLDAALLLHERGATEGTRAEEISESSSPPGPDVLDAPAPDSQDVGDPTPPPTARPVAGLEPTQAEGSVVPSKRCWRCEWSLPFHVEILGVDARMVEEGEIAVAVVDAQHELDVTSTELSSPRSDATPRLVYELECRPDPVRAKIYAWDSREVGPIVSSTVLPPLCPYCGPHPGDDEVQVDLQVDLFELLHVRELRFVDTEGQPIAGRQAVFHVATPVRKPFYSNDGRLVLVFSQLAVEVQGRLEVPGYMDEDLIFTTHPGSWPDDVTLHPGLEVELHLRGGQLSDGERAAGLVILMRGDDMNPRTLTTTGYDARGEARGWSFFFDSEGVVRLRLPRNGEFLARAVLGTWSGSSWKIEAQGEGGEAFSIEPRDGAVPPVELDERAWEELWR